jgi:hypothetical protein
MRSRHLWSSVVAATLVAASTALPACFFGDDSSDCHHGDGGADGGDSGADGGDGGVGESGGYGFILIEASINNCAAVSPVSSSPVNGGSVSLTVTVDPPPPPFNGSAPTLQWSAPSGTFSNPNSPDTTFTCAGPGTVMVTFAATSPGCNQQASAPITCN